MTIQWRQISMRSFPRTLPLPQFHSNSLSFILCFLQIPSQLPFPYNPFTFSISHSWCTIWGKFWYSNSVRSRDGNSRRDPRPARRPRSEVIPFFLLCLFHSLSFIRLFSLYVCLSLSLPLCLSPFLSITFYLSTSVIIHLSNSTSLSRTHTSISIWYLYEFHHISLFYFPPPFLIVYRSIPELSPELLKPNYRSCFGKVFLSKLSQGHVQPQAEKIEGTFNSEDNGYNGELKLQKITFFSMVIFFYSFCPISVSLGSQNFYFLLLLLLIMSIFVTEIIPNSWKFV